MNIKSAELLENSLQNAADNIYRNRALAASMQEESQRNAVEQSFRNAMMQHYANIEQKQADTAALQEQRLTNEDNAVEKKYGVMQAIQDGKDAQQQIMEGLQGLSVDQKLSPTQKTQYLRQSVDAMQPQAKASFLQNPQINALYNGQGDWDAVANLVRQHQAATKASGTGTGPKSNTGDTDGFDRQVNQAPQQIANAVAQADPNVPKDTDTGKPALPVTVNPALVEHMSILAGRLASAGVSSPIQTAAALIFGTNATVQPNVTPSPVPGQNPTTNSFTLTPGGMSQDAVANVQKTPGGPAILNSFSIGQPQNVAQVSKPAVSPISKSASLTNADAATSILNPPSSMIAPAQAVRVRRPDGTTTTIPAVHLNAAMQYGYKPITQ